MEQDDFIEEASDDEFAAVDGSFLNVSNSETVDTAQDHNYVCHVCNRNFKYKSSLKRHMQKHAAVKSPSCGICHQYFSDEDRKLEHNKKYHEARLLCGYVCHVCNRNFKYKSSLKRHMQKHAAVKSPSCGICHQYFADEDRKLEHNRKYHEARLLCGDCGKDFKSKSTLAYHMATTHKQMHEETTSYSCPFDCCGKVFVQKQLYQFHINKHTGHKPFKCSNCPRTFISMYKQIEHEKICKKEKVIKCNICNIKFTDSQSLRRHDNATHRGITYNCECGKRYTQLSSLRRHRLMLNH